VPKRRILVAAAALLLLGLVGVGLLSTRPPARDATPAAPEPSASTPSPPPAPPPRARLPIIDVHVHLSLGGAGRLMRLMQKYGFDHVVNLSGGHPFGRLPDQIAVARAHPGKITVFAALAYEQAEKPGYGERMARILEIAHQQGAKGLKITKGLGLGVPGPDGKLLAVDDPGLDPVFDKAGELGMPVAIHSGDPEAFWLPVNDDNEREAELTAHPGWSLYGEQVPSFDEILNQLERRIARHPQTTFISVHFGNCAEHPDRVARMLRKYPNMYIDTAARIPEMGRHPAREMREFFIEFQDRILYGSDLGVGPEPQPLFLGSSGAEPPTPEEERRFFSATHRYFETADRQFDHPTPIQGNWKIDGIDLPREVLEKVYAKNAAKLLHLELKP
jgi:predicted TIM-barrel fold metal-dependent hydrolase